MYRALAQRTHRPGRVFTDAQRQPSRFTIRAVGREFTDDQRQPSRFTYGLWVENLTTDQRQPSRFTIRAMRQLGSHYLTRAPNPRAPTRTLFGMPHTPGHLPSRGFLRGAPSALFRVSGLPKTPSLRRRLSLFDGCPKPEGTAHGTI